MWIAAFGNSGASSTERQGNGSHFEHERRALERAAEEGAKQQE